MTSIFESPFQSLGTEILFGPHRGSFLYLIQSDLAKKARITSYKHDGQKGGQFSEKRMTGWPVSKGYVTHNVYRSPLRKKHLVSSEFFARFQKFSVVLYLGNTRQRHSSKQEQPEKNSVLSPEGDKPSMHP